MSDPAYYATASAVASQYERWTYPPPIPDLSKLTFTGQITEMRSLKEMHAAYWPAESEFEYRDVLVAGCGTNAAALFAYLHPKSRVTGIDLSAASLAHEQFLKVKHSLSNLTLLQLAIQEVESLGRDFDYIAVHGVLHHILEPSIALHALRNVLKVNGVVSIMLYARYGRAGVYLLQDFFRLLGCRQEPIDLEIVRQSLALLGPDHPIRPYLRMATDLHSESGLVDTFLHPCDTPYTVGDSLALLQSAGLVFQGWDEPIFYYPDIPFARLPADSPLRARLAGLSEPDLWKAMELFGARMPGHFFYACRDDRPRDEYVIDLESDALLSLKPVPRVTSSRLEAGALILERPPLPPLRFVPPQSLLLQQADGIRTVKECLEATPLPPGENLIQLARNLFRYCKRAGYMLFRL